MRLNVQKQYKLIFIVILFKSHTVLLYAISDTSGNPQNYLSYASKMSDVLATEDGSNLDGDCTRKYADAAFLKTSTMMSHISAALSGSGCSEIVTSVTQAQSFISAGDKVLTLNFQLRVYVPL